MKKIPKLPDTTQGCGVLGCNAIIVLVLGSIGAGIGVGLFVTLVERFR